MGAGWRRSGAAFVVLGAVLLGGCGGPGDLTAYREAASSSVESTASAAGTVQLAVDHWLRGDLPRRSAEVLVRDAESGVVGADDDFRAVDPPDASSDRVRSEVTPVLGDCRDVVAGLRIALGRDDTRAAREALAQLDAVLDELESVGTRLR